MPESKPDIKNTQFALKIKLVTSKKSTPDDVTNEYTVKPIRLNLIIILFGAIFFIAIDLLFDFLWINTPPRVQWELSKWMVYLIFILGIIFHELIHAIVLVFYSQKGWKSVKFGINMKAIAPYCHFKEPLKLKYYRRSGMAPLILLGILPLIFAFFSGINWIKIFGILFTIGALGDIAILLKTKNLTKDQIVKDHPDKIGFLVNPKETNPE